MTCNDSENVMLLAKESVHGPKRTHLIELITRAAEVIYDLIEDHTFHIQN